ncbi:hypothetical protein NOV72_05252 [Caballeronia novacaledonica]|uniref:3-oxoacyl-(Acyl carrier protein) synthase n=1 Tax=Caballeronia novacaledonica TaxID=1544861 RepID=A0A2U3ICW2_9BURK|nr:hypothetical protein [Caballeronia novacaledonica]SPB18053.1 hypothetical protein NOV72_05252 [Caballeronia novacaledonica]
MTHRSIAILSSGLVTSVGLSAPASCAAIRAKLSNPTETRFIDSGGNWIMSQQVPFEKPWRGLSRLVKMAASAIGECLSDTERSAWKNLPLLLCVAEKGRPGRFADLDDDLLKKLELELNTKFERRSSVYPQGRVGAALALERARKLIYDEGVEHVIIAAADSLIQWRTLSAYDRAERILTEGNSDGFMPGEAGSAILVGRPRGEGDLCCIGIGFAMEHAHIDSHTPMKGEGLALAINESLRDAERNERELAFKICDLSGEQFYFKEASIAFSRIDRTIRTHFDVWHPAESIGETGAAIGPLLLVVLLAAHRKQYLKGRCILAHLGSDEGLRASIVIQATDRMEAH